MNRSLSFLIAPIFLFCCNLFAQQDELELQEFYFAHTDWKGYNLKGQISQIEYKIERTYDLDSLSFEKEKQLESANYYSIHELPLGPTRFDSIGRLTRMQRFVRDSTVLKHIQVVANGSRFEYYFSYSPNNLNTYQIRKTENSQTFPVFSPYGLKYNRCFRTLEIWRENPTSLKDTVCFYYEYAIDEKRRVHEEIEYSDYGILMRKTNLFDDLDRIIEQKLLMNEDSDEMMRSVWTTTLNHRQSVTEISDTRYFYKYDDQNRITQAKLVSDNELLWRENYFYTDRSYRPIKLERFLKSIKTFGFFFSDNATEYFNEHGDCIKTEYFDDQGNLIRTRYYEYEYDEVGNWIRCDMYLAGSVEKAAKPTITARREITYYD